MSIDIGTLAFCLCLLNALQAAAFVVQYLTDRTHRGAGMWLLWSALTASGYVFLLLRAVLAGAWVQASALTAHTAILLGHVCLYAGIMRFLDRKERRGALRVVSVLFLACTLFFTFAAPDETVRNIVLYISMAAVSFLAAEGLYSNKTPPIAASAGFLSLLLAAYGLHFALRAMTASMLSPADGPFGAAMPRADGLLVPFAAGYLGAFGLILMVNQRARAEIREAKERFELIFNTGPDAAMITRLHDGRLVEVNDGFIAMSGYARGEAVGKSIQDLRYWKTSTDRMGFLRQVNDAGSIENREYPFLRRDGSEYSGMVSAKRITLHGLAHVIHITRDVSDRKRTEEALRESEEKFRLIVENSHDIIYTLSAGGMFLFVSPAWTRLLGHPTSEVVGKSFRAFVHPEDEPACTRFQESVIATGLRGEGIEYRVRHADGTWYWHASSAVPFRDGSGAVAGFYGIARDVTEQRARERNQKELIARLQKALEEIKTLSGIVPICVACKKIRDDGGYWSQVEAYVARHTEAQFSHSLCPECLMRLYPEAAEEAKTAE